MKWWTEDRTFRVWFIGVCHGIAIVFSINLEPSGIVVFGLLSAIALGSHLMLEKP